MSTCTKWENRIVITCKDWGSQLDYECTTWADEGSYECSEWADEGYNSCTSWDECHWYTPWDCIAGFFCRAWYWVAKWVCRGWYWLAKWVCKVFAWVERVFCAVFGWLMELVCVAWDWLRCALLTIAGWIGSIFFRRRTASRKIEHVFVLMLENRSFDHMFGFSGIRGVDPDGNPTVFNEGFDPSTNTNIDPVTNTSFPVSEPADYYLKGIDKDPGHEFENTLTALCGKDANGHQRVYDPAAGYPPIDNSGFVENYRDNGSPTPERIMHCFARRQLPVLNQLAREFAICDRWFSSLPGPTWPNRFFLLAASSGGLDGSPSSLDVVSSTTVEGYRFENGNIFDLLDANCISWSIYEGDDFPVAFAMSGMNLNYLQGRFKDFGDFASDLSNAGFSDRFVFIEPKYGSHEFDATGPGDFSCGNSMHPLDDVTRGEKLIKQVYEAIRNSPHWEKSALIVTFDEHGGFYDHVKPPAAVPPGDVITDAYVQHHFKFDQLGVRVPALIISPFTKKGVIDHMTYDHTSMLATVERTFGIGHLTNRDQAAKDFLHLFSLETARTDTPTTLVNADIADKPLDCGDDSETEDELLLKRSELRIARQRGLYRDRRTSEFPLTSTQVGFVQVALLKILHTTESPEKNHWIEQYKAIRTGIDAAIFMTEAKLKIRYAIDVKKFHTDALQTRASRGRRNDPINIPSP